MRFPCFFAQMSSFCWRRRWHSGAVFRGGCSHSSRNAEPYVENTATVRCLAGWKHMFVVCSFLLGLFFSPVLNLPSFCIFIEFNFVNLVTFSPKLPLFTLFIGFFCFLLFSCVFLLILTLFFFFFSEVGINLAALNICLPLCTLDFGTKPYSQ